MKENDIKTLKHIDVSSAEGRAKFHLFVALLELEKNLMNKKRRKNK